MLKLRLGSEFGPRKTPCLFCRSWCYFFFFFSYAPRQCPLLTLTERRSPRWRKSKPRYNLRRELFENVFRPGRLSRLRLKIFFPNDHNKKKKQTILTTSFGFYNVSKIIRSFLCRDKGHITHCRCGRHRTIVDGDKINQIQFVHYGQNVHFDFDRFPVGVPSPISV